MKLASFSQFALSGGERTYSLEMGDGDEACENGLGTCLPSLSARIEDDW